MQELASCKFISSNKELQVNMKDYSLRSIHEKNVCPALAAGQGPQPLCLITHGISEIRKLGKKEETRLGWADPQICSTNIDTPSLQLVHRRSCLRFARSYPISKPSLLPQTLECAAIPRKRPRAVKVKKRSDGRYGLSRWAVRRCRCR